jgi:MFS family permease
VSDARLPSSTSRLLAAVIAGSALVTLDGAGVTLALPAIGRALRLTPQAVQWVVSMPLLAMAAMLLPAGTLVDRYGPGRVLRVGLLLFSSGALGCATAAAGGVLIGSRFAQGAAAALVLPAALAILRRASDEAAERTRVFAVWAAWTGVAAAIGPLMAALLVDLWSWRAVFLLPAVVGVALAIRLPSRSRALAPTRVQPIPAGATASLIALLGGIAYVLIEGPLPDGKGLSLTLGATVAGTGTVAFARGVAREALLPRDLLSARNCLAANCATFALYFGMFGLSFLIALYVQDVLRYSALTAAIVLLPMSIALVFAPLFGRLAASTGARPFVAISAIIEAAGLAGIGASPHPVPLWALAGGAACVGLGLSIAASPLTHGAVASVADAYAGVASALNHASVRVGGLVAVALLGSLAADRAASLSPAGFQMALLICAAVVAAGGLAASLFLRDREPGGLTPASG